MLKIVTAVPPSPTALPTDFASGPEITSESATIAVSRTIASVTRICSGRSFQNGRPSSTSYSAFDARMKAPT